MTDAALNSKNWVKVMGQSDPELEAALLAGRNSRIQCGEYTLENVKYIDKLTLALAKKPLQVNDTELEKLRHLCQLWDVDLRPREITSHRKFVGPIIVFAKKLFFPVLQVFMKDFIRQQRFFNAAVISFCAEMANSDRENPSDS